MNVFTMDIKRKYEIKNVLYSLSWCILLIQVLFIDNHFPYFPFNITLPAFCLLLLSALFPFEYSPKEIVIIAISGMISMFICYHTKVFTTFWVFAFISCSKGINLKPLFFKLLIIFSIFFLVTTALSFTGILEDKIRYATANSRFPKHYLGMTDPNYAHMIFLLIIDLIFILFYQRLSYAKLFLLLILNTVIFLLTFCKTSAAIIYFMIVAAFIEKFLSPHISKKIYNLILILLFICVVSLVFFIIYISIFYDPSIHWHQEINNFLTGRPNLSIHFFSKYDIKPFGNYFVEFLEPGHRETLDIGFDVLLIQYGYIFTAFYIIGYFFLFINYIRESNFAGILLVTSVLLHMSAENHALIFFYNFSYVLLRFLIFKTDKPDELFAMPNT